MKLIIVTGLSGSGKSIALHTLEDQGFYCIDNLPVRLLQAFVDELIREREEPYERTAVGIDARNPPGELALVPPLARRLREQGIACEMLFLDAAHDTLIRRFSETRRKHPLTTNERPLAEAIRLEQRLMEPFQSNADLHVDTTHTTVHELRDMLRNRVADRPENAESILFQSFGFKNGVPRDADFVFDVRCLPNPYWQVTLRPLTGQDPKVVQFLEQDPQVLEMRDDMIGFLDRWIPRFGSDGRSYLTVAVGCTGGQHRSVYMVEQIAGHLRQAGRRILTRHRELS
jgi:UPF0042 nucleotide-binding protein